MRESIVEDYLIKMVKQAGGETRKLKYIERKSATDRLVLFPGKHFFVETKATGEKPEAAQKREHKRLRSAGCDVSVIDSLEGVDNFIARVIR